MAVWRTEHFPFKRIKKIGRKTIIIKCGKYSSKTFVFVDKKKKEMKARYIQHEIKLFSRVLNSPELIEKYKSLRWDFRSPPMIRPAMRRAVNNYLPYFSFDHVSVYYFRDIVSMTSFCVEVGIPVVQDLNREWLRQTCLRYYYIYNNDYDSPLHNCIIR